MSAVFKSNCDWRFVTGRRRAASADVPQRVEEWIGRYDKLEIFLAEKALGTAHNGGYITGHDVRDAVPKSEVDLIVTYAPVLNTPSIRTSRSIKTATKSATVTGDNLVPAHLLPEDMEQPTSVQAKRTVSFYAAETRYEYFRESAPTTPGYTTGDGREPVLIRSAIEVSFNGVNIAFTGATAPAAIITALTMPAVDRVVSDGGEPIEGTPWYRCADVVTRELEGD